MRQKLCKIRNIVYRSYFADIVRWARNKIPRPAVAAPCGYVILKAVQDSFPRQSRKRSVTRCSQNHERLTDALLAGNCWVTPKGAQESGENGLRGHCCRWLSSREHLQPEPDPTVPKAVSGCLRSGFSEANALRTERQGKGGGKSSASHREIHYVNTSELPETFCWFVCSIFWILSESWNHRILYGDALKQCPWL